MRTYTCFLTDSRYAVPTLFFLFTQDEERARMLARRELVASRYHTCFELLEGDRLVLSEGQEVREDSLA